MRQGFCQRHPRSDNVIDGLVQKYPCIIRAHIYELSSARTYTSIWSPRACALHCLSHPALLWYCRADLVRVLRPAGPRSCRMSGVLLLLTSLSEFMFVGRPPRDKTIRESAVVDRVVRLVLRQDFVGGELLKRGSRQKYLARRMGAVNVTPSTDRGQHPCQM